MVKKSYGGMAACTSSSQISENEPRQNFRLGDMTWVKHDGSSWWPAQVWCIHIPSILYFN
jgi:hypothetical protein